MVSRSLLDFLLSQIRFLYIRNLNSSYKKIPCIFFSDIDKWNFLCKKMIFLIIIRFFFLYQLIFDFLILENDHNDFVEVHSLSTSLTFCLREYYHCTKPTYHFFYFQKKNCTYDPKRYDAVRFYFLLFNYSLIKY